MRWPVILSGGGSNLPTPSNNLVVGVGDSITVASQNTAGGGITTNTGFNARILNPSGNVGGYLTWAAMLPVSGQSAGDGRFQFIGTHATSGQTAAQIKTNHIDGADSPLNDNPKAGICAVLAGSNDIGTMAPAGNVNDAAVQSVADTVESMWNTLIDAGILPVCCLLPPNNGVGAVAIPVFNSEIRNRATALGIPIADLYTPCVGTAPNWAANHNVDSPHPSVLGAKKMGQALRDAVDYYLPAAEPNLVTAATDGDADLVWENGAMERDGDSDGRPNGGGQGLEINGYYTFTAAGATSALGARSNFDGQAWTIDKAADSGQTTIIGSGAASFITLVNGHTYEIGFVGEIESWSGTDTQWAMSICTKIVGSQRPLDLTLRKDASYADPIPPFIFFRRFLCSDAGNFPSGTYRPNITIGHGAGSPADNLAKIHMGQFTIRDLGVI